MAVKKLSPAGEGMTAHLYRKLLPVLILSCMVIAANSLIDSIFAGRCLGTQAMALIGLFAPVSTLLSGLASIFATGAQQRCCTEMGNGESKRVDRIFNTGVLFLVGSGILLTAVLLLLRKELAAGLGADGGLNAGLAAYSAGISIGVIGQLLSSYLMPFLQLNGKNDHSYLAMVVNLAGNVCFNTLFVAVLQWGLFGLGLATSLSGLLCMCSMLPCFCKKEELVHFEWVRILPRDLWDILRVGSPVLMFQVGLFIKNYGMNQALLNGSTVEAVAVLTLQGSLCGLLGALPYGSSVAVQMLASFYIGEGDRDSLRNVFRVALKTGLVLSVPIILCLLLFAKPILFLFGIKDTATQAMAVRMLCFLCAGIIPNLFSAVLTKLFQAAEKLVLTNTVTLVENAFQGVFALLFVGVIGTDAAWCTFAMASILTILLILLYGFSGWSGRRHDLCGFLHFPDDFGVSQEQRLVLALHSMEDVVDASRQISSSCTAYGAPERAAMAAGLCVEEMAGNVVQYGFPKNGKGCVWVLAVFHGEKLTLRIRDNCIRFDPQKYLLLAHPDDPAEHIGIRLVTKLADTVSYQNVFGMNMLTLEIRT